MAFGTTRKFALVLISLFEILLFGGLQYGWGSLLFILKEEKLFEHLCDGNGTALNATKTENTVARQVDCFERDERFNLIFSVALATMTALNVVFGQFHYVIGIKPTRGISMYVFCITS